MTMSETPSASAVFTISFPRLPMGTRTILRTLLLECPADIDDLMDLLRSLRWLGLPDQVESPVARATGDIFPVVT